MSGEKVLELRVPERGDLEIDNGTWRRLSEDPAFWALVDRKYLGVSAGGRGRMTLTGAAHVGRALVGDVSVSIVPKIPGALTSLISFTTARAFKVERLPTAATELGELATLIVHQFIDVATAYASKGRKWEYRRRREVRSLLGGRLNLTLTLSLRARGLGHLLAFERNNEAYNVPLNRVTFAALREVEWLARVLRISGSDLSDARGLALLFSDCRDAAILFGRREALGAIAEDLADDLTVADERDLAALAAVLLAHGSFELSDVIAGRAPRAWFLNLETLFEAAVRKIMRKLCGPAVKVEKGGSEKPAVFELGKDKYTANPDLLFRAGPAVIAAGDAKYKDWPATADAGDLYQLLVHAEAFDAPSAFLVYPGDSFRVEDLGKSVTGAHTWRFAVNVLDLQGDLARIVDLLGLGGASNSVQVA